jgi:hypothetical protein
VPLGFLAVLFRHRVIPNPDSISPDGPLSLFQSTPPPSGTWPSSSKAASPSMTPPAHRTTPHPPPRRTCA